MLLLYVPALVRIVRTSQVTMARFLSVCVLLLSLTPMTSLYVFYSLLTTPPTTDDDDQQRQYQHTTIDSISSTNDPVNEGNDDGNNTVVDTVEAFLLRLVFNRLSANPYSMTADFSATFEAIQGASSSSSSSPSSSDSIGTANYHFAMVQHSLPSMFTVLLPWTLSVVLGLIFPLMICIYDALTRRGGWLYKSQKRRRKKMLLRQLNEHQKVLTTADRVDDGTSFADDDLITRDDEHDNVETSANSYGRNRSREAASGHINDSENVSDSDSDSVPALVESDMCPTTTCLSCSTGSDRKRTARDTEHAGHQWYIPQPGVSNTQQQRHPTTQRIISGSCVICLLPYKRGDTVSWSSNPECIHYFHHSCIASWLGRSRNQSTWPCPCCRQCFLPGDGKTTVLSS